MRCGGRDERPPSFGCVGGLGKERIWSVFSGRPTWNTKNGLSLTKMCPDFVSHYEPN